MTAPAPPDPVHRRRRVAIRSLWIASAAAFAGGVAVVGVQYAVGRVSANYPPVVLSLLCSAGDDVSGGAIAVRPDEGNIILPVIELPARATISCRLDAPAADYATWMVLGPTTGIRSGLLDESLPCQSSEDFANQDASSLRLSVCQRMRGDIPGLYLLVVTVMQRGQPVTDRSRLLLRIVPPTEPADTAAAPQEERLAVTLRLPAGAEEIEHEANLSAAFSEHALWPQSRTFERTVYRLADGEQFVSAAFRARSAANASAVRLAYVPQSRTVTARFTLRSGPIVDRWRGWLSGTVAVKVRQERQASDVDLPEMRLATPGSVEVPLPEGIDATRARIVIRRPGTATLAEVAPDGTASLDGTRIRVEWRDGRLFLEARRD